MRYIRCILFRLITISFLMRFLLEAREAFDTKYKDNESVNIEAEWKSQLAMIRAKAYRRVVSRREEAKIFSIMDKGKRI